jgi:glyoxylase-like metal-dependent hydrolase (beta-lactamase superfamily II)
MASYELLWAEMETPDGIILPGPHGTSAASEIYPGISSAIQFIISGGEALMTDPGFRTVADYPSGVVSRVSDILDSRRLRLRYIVQTHWHFDHTGNTQYIKERYGAEVLCHPRERAILEDPTLATRPEYIASFGGDASEIAEDFNLGDASSVLMPAETLQRFWHFPVEIDGTVEDGDVLRVGDLQIEVLHTPGHTPGHLSLYNPSSNSLYLMDVMYWPTPLHPHPVGRIDEQLASIEKCLALARGGRVDYLFVGHELPRCGPEDVIDYLEDLLIKHLQIERRALVLLSRHGQLTVPELHAETFVVKDRYDYAHNGWYTYSLNCLQAHLRRLLDGGKVSRERRADGSIAWGVTEAGRLADEEIEVRGGYERAVRVQGDLGMHPPAVLAGPSVAESPAKA